MHASMPSTKTELIPAFADLPEALIAELNAIGRTRTFQSGQTVMYGGTHPDFIGCVRRGILRMVRRDVDGREQVVGLLADGDIFGRVFHGNLRFDKEAATDAEIVTFLRGPFEALVEKWPELELLIMSNLANELDHARDWMVLLTKHPMTARLASFLLMICCRWNNMANTGRFEHGKLVLRVPISRSDLSSLLGTQPETLSRTVHAMAEKGAFTILSPQEFEILDLDALLHLADDEEFASNERLASVRLRLKGEFG